MPTTNSTAGKDVPDQSPLESKLGEGVINQGLFHLNWLVGHRAEFEGLVRGRLGAPAASQVLWSGPQLICVAGDFTRYDMHAVREHRRDRPGSFATASSAAICSGLRP